MATKLTTRERNRNKGKKPLKNINVEGHNLGLISKQLPDYAFQVDGDSILIPQDGNVVRDTLSIDDKEKVRTSQSLSLSIRPKSPDDKYYKGTIAVSFDPIKQLPKSIKKEILKKFHKGEDVYLLGLDKGQRFFLSYSIVKFSTTETKHTFEIKHSKFKDFKLFAQVIDHGIVKHHEYRNGQKCDVLNDCRLVQAGEIEQYKNFCERIHVTSDNIHNGKWIDAIGSLIYNLKRSFPKDFYKIKHLDVALYKQCCNRIHQVGKWIFPEYDDCGHRGYLSSKFENNLIRFRSTISKLISIAEVSPDIQEVEEELSKLKELRDFITRKKNGLKKDRNRKVAAALCKHLRLPSGNFVDCVITENLKSYKYNNEKSKEENTRLSTWAHMSVEKQLQDNLNKFGIHLEGINPSYTSLTDPSKSVESKNDYIFADSPRLRKYNVNKPESIIKATEEAFFARKPSKVHKEVRKQVILNYGYKVPFNEYDSDYSVIWDSIGALKQFRGDQFVEFLKNQRREELYLPYRSGEYAAFKNTIIPADERAAITIACKRMKNWLAY